MSSIIRKQVDQVNQNSPRPAAPAPDAPAHEVLETIHAIMHLVRSQQHRSLRAAQHDLAHMDVKVLGYFARHPGATQSDLAAHSGRDKAQLTRLIRGLRERGLLDAAPDASDRRSTRLRLSAAGLGLHAALHVDDGRLAEVALDGMAPAERAALQALLDKVRANLEAG